MSFFLFEMKGCVNEAIPASQLNHARISEITGGRYSRDLVERVLREAFIAIGRFLREDGRVMITFSGLGCLVVDRLRFTRIKTEGFFKFTPTVTNFLPYLV